MIQEDLPEWPVGPTLKGHEGRVAILRLMAEETVTPEMRAAVDHEFVSGCCIVDVDTCVAIYRAMRAAAPAATEPRDTDYIGPRDASHERAHEVVKDILNGRITQPARRQIQEALKSAPADPKAFPNGALSGTSQGDPRRVGWRP